MTSYQDLLINLLKKSLDNTLSRLELRTKEQFDSITNTSKYYSDFTVSIDKMVKEFNEYSKKKELENEQRLLEKENKAKTASKNDRNGSQRVKENNRAASPEIKPIKIRNGIGIGASGHKSNINSFTSRPSINHNTITKDNNSKGMMSMRGSLTNTNTTSSRVSIDRNNNNTNTKQDKEKTIRHSKTVKELKTKKLSLDNKALPPEKETKPKGKHVSKGSMITPKKPSIIKDEKVTVTPSTTILNTETKGNTIIPLIEIKPTEEIQPIESNNNNKEVKSFQLFFDKTNLESAWKGIIDFLPQNDRLTLFSTSKIFKSQFIKEITDTINTITEELNYQNGQTIDDKIAELTIKYKPHELAGPIPQFILTRGAEKAIMLLNEKLYHHLFEKTKLEPSLKEVIVIFRIFFQLMAIEHIVAMKNDEEFWTECCRYFHNVIESEDGKLGTYFAAICDKFSFDDSNVFKINRISHGYKMKLIPSYFSKTSGTVSIILFVIKDALEHCGVLYSDKRTPPCRILSNLNYIKHVLSHLNNYITYLNTVLS